MSAIYVNPTNIGGYDAVRQSNRRRPIPIITKSEDRHLDQSDRRSLIAGIRQIRRNFSLVSWMIRRHQDFVTNYRFQPRTGNDAVNQQFSKLIKKYSKPQYAHSRGRFSLPQLIRVAEGLRTVDGDCGWYRLNDQSIQLIEGDRVRNPIGWPGYNRAHWRHGVRCDDRGRPQEYAIAKRIDGGSMFVHERNIPARDMILHGYFEREDQWRGISPLASAYNSSQDVYEWADYTLARTKIESLFGIKFSREANTYEEDDGVDEDGQRYPINWGAGIFSIDLEPGDDAAFLNSSHPASSTIEYIQNTLILVMKALDIPFSFFREDFSNYLGSKAQWLLYERACEPKREDNQFLLDDWTYHRAVDWVISGELVLPANVVIEDQPWEWVPRKVPAFKRIEDVKADILALQAGLTNPEGVCREDDEGSFRENINDIAQALDYAKEVGVAMVWDVENNPNISNDDGSRGLENSDIDN